MEELDDVLYDIFVLAEKLKDRIIWCKDSIPQEYYEDLCGLAYAISEKTTYKLG